MGGTATPLQSRLLQRQRSGPAEKGLPGDQARKTGPDRLNFTVSPGAWVVVAPFYRGELQERSRASRSGLSAHRSEPRQRIIDFAVGANVELIQRMSIGHEQLRMIERSFLETDAQIDESFQESNQIRFLR